jgi:hypothetical protein
MTATPRPRPPTTMTQVMRPSCEVYGAPELHTYLGPGINNFGSPCLMSAEIALWWSDGTAWDADEDTSKKSATVFAANDPLLKQASKAAGRKHHLVLALGQSLVPPAPVAMWGQNGLHLPLEWVDAATQDKGESTAIYAPRHVRADIDGTHDVATLRWPGGASMGPGNLSVCCDPIDSPLTFAHQTPNTVFLGMTTADTVGSMVAWLITSVANGLLKLLVDRLVGHLSKQLAKYLSRAIGRAALPVVRQLLRLARRAGVYGVETASAAGIDAALESFFNMPDGRFDHSSIDDGIADLWDEHMVSP